MFLSKHIGCFRRLPWRRRHRLRRSRVGIDAVLHIAHVRGLILDQRIWHAGGVRRHAILQIGAHRLDRLPKLLNPQRAVSPGKLLRLRNAGSNQLLHRRVPTLLIADGHQGIVDHVQLLQARRHLIGRDVLIESIVLIRWAADRASRTGGGAPRRRRRRPLRRWRRARIRIRTSAAEAMACSGQCTARPLARPV